MKRWRWVTVMLAALAVAVVGFATPASAGNGVQPCGSGCDLQDPNTYYAYDNVRIEFYTCASDAVNIGSPVMGLQLRYSPKCETTWGKMVGNCSCHFLSVYIRSYDHYPHVRLESNAIAPTNNAVSVMLDDHNLLNRACLAYTDENNPPGYYEACTRLY